MKSLILLSLLLVVEVSLSQAVYQYVISFSDKEGNGFSLEHPEAYLSSRSIARRERQKIPITEQDLPITSAYVQELLKIDSISIKSRSKWFNDVVIEVKDTSLIQKIRDLSFVSTVYEIPSQYSKTIESVREKFDVDSWSIDSASAGRYAHSYVQIHMISGDYLHQTGFRGKGMRIAVIDAGFSDVPGHLMLEKLESEGRIIANMDFVDKKADVYAHSRHGTYVLTTMAADVTGVMIGTAPDAEYLLLRSEDGAKEYLLEEYFWVEAAEFADSAGADVINTSLGYTTFDDSVQNHTHEDMDGKSTRITLASDLAAHKGMLLFNSAGNSGDDSWQKIGAPADAFDLIAVGAVGPDRTIANFSSRGPSADGRIKPDLCAQGSSVVIGNPDGTVRASNGTSFASPVLAGMGACLWQSNITKTWKEVKDALIGSGDMSSNPDTNYGYGIPNAIVANGLLKSEELQNIEDDVWISLGPNPFSNTLICTYKSDERTKAKIKFIDINGRLVNESEQWLEEGITSYLIIEGNDLPQVSAMFILELTVNDQKSQFKVIRY